MKKSAEDSNWGGDMPRRTQISPENIRISELVSLLSKSQREKLISGYDLKNFAKVFEDGDTMSTVDSFLKYGLNVSETSRRMYMHRNTLIYRLNKILEITGLDLRVFEMAVTFEILHSLYQQK